MDPGHSSSLRIGGDSSAISGSGWTGGESNRLAVVVPRDAPGEPPSTLGKGKDKIDEVKYPVGSVSNLDSRSDPISGSEPSLGCETIYWDSLLFFL